MFLFAFCNQEPKTENIKPVNRGWNYGEIICLVKNVGIITLPFCVNKKEVRNCHFKFHNLRACPDVSLVKLTHNVYLM